MVKRPWGHYEVLATGKGYKVKRLTILPGKRTSLQKHRFRDEYWTIVSGPQKGIRLSIPKNHKHRISNKGDKPVVYIEVQLGERCEEKDILRIADDYGRANPTRSI